MLLLSFVSSALAVTVPVRAVHVEWVSPGETPVAAAATATVKVSNPTTGQGFKASANELTPTKVEATGKGDVSFDADPAGSIRTWAMYFINADGELLGDPELVDVVFDENGNASLAGSDGARLAGVTVRGTSPVGSEWAGGLVVDVQDSGVDAAYVGLVEITSDGSRLATVPDLGILDLSSYATFQELGLDAIVALARFRVRLDGDVELDNAAVNAKGVIEDGQELRWDLTFSTVAVKGANGWEATTLGTESYLQAAGSVKKKTPTVAARVDLSWKDVTYDAWDAGIVLSIDGDQRGLELGASLSAYEGATRMASSDVILLDATSLDVKAKIDMDSGTGDRVRIDLRDSAGKVLSQHYCALAPTAATLADPEVDTWVGDCSSDGLVARPRVKKSKKACTVKGPCSTEKGWTGVAAFATPPTGASSAEAAAMLGGDVAFYGPEGEFLGSSTPTINETEWNLAFAFKDDVDGLDAELAVYLEAPAYPKLGWTLDENGDATGSNDGVTYFSVDASSIGASTAGIYALDVGNQGDDFLLAVGAGSTNSAGTLKVLRSSEFLPEFKKVRR